MGILNNVKQQAEKLPEFSEKNYPIAGYIVAAIITLTGGFLIYEVLISDALTFKAQWNMFKSSFGSLCCFIGFIWAMLWWGKFTHWSSTPIIETRDRYGNVLKREENYDVMEQSFSKLLMPLIGHFILEPIMYGAIIYYPIQCIIALVGAIFPYILSIIVLVIIVGSWLFTHYVQCRYRSTLLVLCGILFSLAFGWGGYVIMNSMSESEIDEQFVGIGKEGLLGSLSIGTTEYVGDMDGNPIEFTITKDESNEVNAVYKNLNSSTTMNLSGESLPAMGGDISFFGLDDNNNDWTFNLNGDAEHISGMVQSSDGQEMQITLHLK